MRRVSSASTNGKLSTQEQVVATGKTGNASDVVLKEGTLNTECKHEWRPTPGAAYEETCQKCGLDRYV